MGAIKVTGQSVAPTVTASDAGMIYYDSTSNALKVYNGTAWEEGRSFRQYNVDFAAVEGGGGGGG